MLILGISCYYHDSAACLVKDGHIVAAAQEERFTRKKHDQSFPANAIEFCLKQGGYTIENIDFVSFYDKPFLKFERLLETYLAFAPRGLRSAWKGIPIWIKEKMWISDHIKTQLGFQGTLLYTEHHQSHAASAFFPSPYHDAAVLTMDGVGEWASSSLSHGSGNQLKILAEQHFPHSLGLLYSAFTYFTGFRVNSGEYKLMGLAPYGEPVYVPIILDKLIDLKQDGSFRMNQEYFNYCAGLTMTNHRFADLFGGPRRKPETPITSREMDIAASIQKVTELIVMRSAAFAKKETGSNNLCLAGGVALNCVSNGKLQASGLFKNIWVQPSSGDAGGALGAALFTWYQYLNNDRLSDETNDTMQGAYLGPQWSNHQIKSFLNDNSIHHKFIEEDDFLAQAVAAELDGGQVVGWFQGRMEFGPRALGNRSILGDPRSEEMQKNLNVKIKFRESFRPFAPSVLSEHTSEYFDFAAISPYMLMVAPVHRNILHPVDDVACGFDKLYQKRSALPAITHVDNSARVQTVHQNTNPLYHKLISAFRDRTGVPVLINTSFNVRGEPIVCSPEDAWRCFMRTNMDILVMGNYVIYKRDQEILPDTEEWKEEFPLD
jgi:carbamoyltransferase